MNNLRLSYFNTFLHIGDINANEDFTNTDMFIETELENKGKLPLPYMRSFQQIHTYSVMLPWRVSIDSTDFLV